MAKKYDIVPLLLATEDDESDTWAADESWSEDGGLVCVDVEQKTGRAFTFWIPMWGWVREKALECARSTIKELIKENI